MSETNENAVVMNTYGLALFVASSALFRSFLTSSSSSSSSTKEAKKEKRIKFIFDHNNPPSNRNGDDVVNSNSDAIIRRRNYMKTCRLSFGSYVEANQSNDSDKNIDGTNSKGSDTANKKCDTDNHDWKLATRRFDHHFDLDQEHEHDSCSTYDDILSSGNPASHCENKYCEREEDLSKDANTKCSISTSMNTISSSQSKTSNHAYTNSKNQNFRTFGRLSYTNRGGMNSGIPKSAFSIKQQQQNEHHSIGNEDFNEDCAAFNSRIMPRRLVLIRHGQSEGNVNESLYASCPDSNIRLTKRGWEQAKNAGKILRDQIILKNQNNSSGSGSGSDGENNPTVHFIVSPYVRTVETFHGIASAWCDPNDFKHIKNEEERLVAWYETLSKMGVTFNEDPRIREQDFGNYQDKDKMKQYKKERIKYGIFYYRFPNGESASDVYDRISTFLDSLWRSFSANKSQNYVLVTHGISIRVLLARYFRYSINQFNVMSNPSNCEMVLLGHDGQGRLELEGRCELVENQNQENEKEGDSNLKISHRFFKKLKVLKNPSGMRKIRMDYC